MNEQTPVDTGSVSTVDIEQFSQNVARLVEEGGKALAAYLKPREEGQIKAEVADEVTDAVKTLGQVAQYWLSDPQRAVELQSSLAKAYLDLWSNTARRLAGQEAAPAAAPEPEVGRNLAVTPGKVVFQNDLMQLIQYAPSTDKVLKVPVLIVPPWINKFYILDLTPEKSFIKWCVDQGLTVFVVSWVNPDERLAAKSFEDYMREGPLQALDAIAEVTGEDKVHAIGYCVGGTLLSITLAYMAARGVDRIMSATMFAAQV